MSECIFCQIVQGNAPSWKIMENDYCYAFLDINPVSKYHTLVIPKKHFENIFEIDEKYLTEVSLMIRNLCKIYRSKLGVSNLQIVNSNGVEGQQDVFHIHFHIVPRSYGDGQNIRWKTHPEWRKDFDPVEFNACCLLNDIFEILGRSRSVLEFRVVIRIYGSGKK